MAGHLSWRHQGGSEAATERAQGNGSGSERSRLARQRPLEASIPPHRSESIWECGVFIGFSGLPCGNSRWTSAHACELGESQSKNVCQTCIFGLFGVLGIKLLVKALSLIHI